MSTSIHITAWAIGIILFLVTFFMYKNKNPKSKMLHMIVRLLYIIIFITGFLLFWGVMKQINNHYQMLYGFKMLGGLWVIAAMEITLVSISKGKNPAAGWIQFIIAFLIVLYLGLSLPLGWYEFK
ncbi:YisL family protein [Bacillus sp. BRMEA1]|uniref:YisL family protein n=1 Tax=Neobacillus endophyticus TaxID=2738405 RepID=UPI0015639000|nr:YisL family protein [Neobacillus endophyticus]NRD78305.1 YisL family protein [Neobacillus endophyticus]